MAQIKISDGKVDTNSALKLVSLTYPRGRCQ